MRLPDEAVAYQYQSALFQPKPDDDWTAALELQGKHFVSPARLKALMPQLNQVRSQVATERETLNPPPHLKPLDSAFIDLPEKLLTEFRRKTHESELARIEAAAQRIREMVDRVIILGIGGSSMGAKAIFSALRSTYHNELSPETRLGTPRIYFEGDNLDNDAFQDLLEMLQTTCVNPQVRDERWAAVVISKSGGTLETAVALRVFRREALEYYGHRSPWLKEVVVPITGTTDSALRDVLKKEGYQDTEIFNVPDRVGGRFSVFSAVGLLPAAIMGLDVRALLMGAAAATRQFIDETFERNPVLQMAAINYLMAQELGKPIRVLALWSKKLEAFGAWYDQLVSESLGKQGGGPTPITSVLTRDLHSRGQQHQDGARDKFFVNVAVQSPRSTPINVGMADRNEDNLNQFNRRTYAELMDAARQGTNQAYLDTARPTVDVVLPTLNEHVLGQLMQMMMLSTVVEGRLMGINPYGQPGVQAYKKRMMAILKSMPVPK